VDSYIGVSIGFAVGLVLVFGLESVIDFIAGGNTEDKKEEHEVKPAAEPTEKLSDGSSTDTYNSDTNSPFHSHSNTQNHVKTKVDGDFSAVDREVRKKTIDEGEWDESTVQQSAQAMKLPQHRHHIIQHLDEIVESLNGMEEKCTKLSCPELNRQEMEQVSEEIDEATHSLQYKLDHTRRLLQGSESMLQGDIASPCVLSEEKIIAMKHRLQLLQASATHVIGHMNGGTYDLSTIKEIYEHMEDMDHVISSFHDQVANATSRWTRRHRILPDTNVGDVVPVSLVIPVTMDCFVDGFLIGVTCALSPNAGIVLGCANCLEMSFLGMAYALRITKCTGSSQFVRTLTLYSPPLLMFLASGFGAFVAQVSRDVPAVFVAFVSFGIVALLALVCGELLIEARECQGEEAKWYVQLCLFAGVYLVIMMAHTV
jgi:zinc transporter ZupT